MPSSRDNQRKPVKRVLTKKEKLREEALRSKKHSRGDDHSDYDEDDDDFIDDGEEEEEELDIHAYRKLLAELYPSKHANQKVEQGEKLKKLLAQKKKNKKNKKNNKKVETDSSSSSSSSSSYDSDEDSDYDDSEEDSEEETLYETADENEESDTETEEDDEDDEESRRKKSKKSSKSKAKAKKQGKEGKEGKDKKKSKDKGSKGEGKEEAKYNIIFTIEDKERDDEYYDDETYYEDEEDDDSTEENEDEEVSSCSSSSESDNEDSDSGDEDSDSGDEDDEEVDTKRDRKDQQRKQKMRSMLKKIDQAVKKEKIKTSNREEKKCCLPIPPTDDKQQADKCETSRSSHSLHLEDEQDDETLLKTLKTLHEKNKKNKLLLECIDYYEDNLQKQKKKQEKKLKKQKAKNERIFGRMVKDKSQLNDYGYFRTLEMEHQKKMIKEMRSLNEIIRVEKPYRFSILDSSIPADLKASAIKKINSLRYMEPGSGEYYKIKNWVDTFMRIPFGKYEVLPVTMENGVEACHDFMEKAQKTLNDAVYGLNDAKMQIMQMLGQLIINPSSVGTAIAIHGPPGTGKTSLVKEGISKILNRPFAFIALGGATDSSFLEGHSYTYEGSTWGKIVQIIIDSKCMNPVIYFDELDKISETPKGEEIAGILTHLTDTSQNMQFHDKYFSEIPFDLSKCLFIFSYNDESKVNPILRDRMYRIQTKGYTQPQKMIICNQYLLPRIREQVKFKADEIVIPDVCISHIIENYCNKEDGVRNLKRCVEIVFTKLNLYRLMKPDTNLFEQDMALKVEFPFVVTRAIVDKLIKQEKEINPSLLSMYV
jgi:ATP-dependent Lon protease